MNKKPLGIYIHIPFCVRKCNYCDFLSNTAKKEQIQDYIQSLIQEIRSYGKMPFKKSHIITSIYLGGGTPSLITEEQIEQILLSIRANFRLKERIEITLEANPGTLNERKLHNYRKNGINRLSIGLQSADNKELKLLGRIHTWENFLKNYEQARAAGFLNINVDLISGLPGQTVESFHSTVEKVLALQPEHISVYGLIIEEGTPFYEYYGEKIGQKKDILPLPDEETDRVLYHKTKEWLKRWGYNRYEISNYARPGYESIHNCMYWERGEYLGMGLGASSFFDGRRYHNEKEMKEYLLFASEQENLHKEEEVLTREQEMEEFIFLGLRMTKGISKAKFYHEFGVPLEKIYGSVIRKQLSQGLVAETEDRIFLTEYGIDISNYVCSEYLF